MRRSRSLAILMVAALGACAPSETPRPASSAPAPPSLAAVEPGPSRCAAEETQGASPADWVPVATGIDPDRDGVAFVASRPGCPPVYVAITAGGTVLRSVGGSEWETGGRLEVPWDPPPSHVEVTGLAEFNGRFVAVADVPGAVGAGNGAAGTVVLADYSVRGGLVWTSEEGSSWIAAELPNIDGSPAKVERLLRYRSWLVGIAQIPSGTESGLMRTQDGTLWEFQLIDDPLDHPYPNPFTDLVELPDGQLAVFGSSRAHGTTCSGGYGGIELLGGPDPLTVDAPPFEARGMDNACTFLQRVLRNGSRLVAAGRGLGGGANSSSSSILVSTDGLAWQEVPADGRTLPSSLRGVTASGVFVGVDGHAVLTSLDGVTWAPAVTDESTEQLDIVVAGDLAIVCGTPAGCTAYAIQP